MQSLGRMASSIVRDFNNVFTAILGNTELLLGNVRGEGLERGLPVARRELVGHETVLVC
ncbi:MAG: hypothetical protein GWO04_08000, partial [Actinobacteria bacterium]|nr:hypothetical protein [Actinomycetota bacterium]